LLEEELFLIRGEGPIINSPTSLINGIEHTLERHELRLLAVGPLPPIDEDSGEEESIEFNAEALLNYFRLTFDFGNIWQEF
jgi:hypothetical protein